ERGRAQARALAAALRTERPVAVYASPLARARETAACIAEPNGLSVVPVPALSEMNYGVLEGVDLRALAVDERALLEQWRLRPAAFRMPDGESLAEVQARAWAWVETAVARHG